jgi:hypothetical protein
MNHTQFLIKKAKELGELLTVNYDSKSFRYLVDIDSVFYREKTTYFKKAILGEGFSVEDACMDYLRKARGGLLVHVITDEMIEPI